MILNKKIVIFIVLLFIPNIFSKTVRNKSFFAYQSTAFYNIQEQGLHSSLTHEIKVENGENKRNRLMQQRAKQKRRNKRRKASVVNEYDKKITDELFVGASAFYEKSTNATDMARYFFPNGKTELTVMGDKAAADAIAAGNPGPDIFAEWLGIPSTTALDDADGLNFSSKIKMAPSVKKLGMTVYMQKKLFEHGWISLFVPVQEVTTNMHFQEYDISGQRDETLRPNNVDYSLYYGEPFNATQAFAQPLMKYGKIDNLSHRRAGFADMTARLGYSKIFGRNVLDSYLSLIIPTSDKPKAEYLLEPLVGNGGHLGVGVGFTMDFELSEQLNFITGFDCQYLFGSNEKRSFDLVNNGPWSRYMAGYTGLPRTKPARLINYLTTDFKVTPGADINIMTTLKYCCCTWFVFEVGANIEVKSAEKVSLKRDISNQVGIAYLSAGSIQNSITNDDFMRSYSLGAINKRMIIDPDTQSDYGTDLKMKFITNDDVNLWSVKNSSQALYLFYGSLAAKGSIKKSVFQVKVGSSYKCSDGNSSIDMWGIWAGGSLSI